MKIWTLTLTCANNSEATKIAEALLYKKLVACVKFLPVTAHFLWNGNVDRAEEILLIMETIDEKFDAIEQEVRELHSYETFVLTATKVEKVSAGVLDWIMQSLS